MFVTCKVNNSVISSRCNIIRFILICLLYYRTNHSDKLIKEFIAKPLTLSSFSHRLNELIMDVNRWIGCKSTNVNWLNELWWRVALRIPWTCFDMLDRPVTLYVYINTNIYLLMHYYWLYFICINTNLLTSTNRDRYR